jgi:hypothetical protein
MEACRFVHFEMQPEHDTMTRVQKVVKTRIKTRQRGETQRIDETQIPSPASRATKQAKTRRFEVSKCCTQSSWQPKIRTKKIMATSEKMPQQYPQLSREDMAVGFCVDQIDGIGSRRAGRQSTPTAHFLDQ